MRVALLDAVGVFRLLFSRPYTVLRAYVYVAGSPLVELLCSKPPGVRGRSAVFVDSEKREANRWAAERLLGCGVPVYEAPGLHAKLYVLGEPPLVEAVVVGSVNPTRRSRGRRFELAVAVLEPGEELLQQLLGFTRRVEASARPWRG